MFITSQDEIEKTFFGNSLFMLFLWKMLRKHLSCSLPTLPLTDHKLWSTMTSSRNADKKKQTSRTLDFSKHENIKKQKHTNSGSMRNVFFADSVYKKGVWVCWCCVLFALLIVLWCVVFLLYVVVATLSWLIIAFFVGCSWTHVISKFFGVVQKLTFSRFWFFLTWPWKTRHPCNQLIISYDQWTYLNFSYSSS